MNRRSSIFVYSKLIVFVVLILTVLGGRAYTTMPQSIFPAISIARLDVVVEAGDLPPEQVDVAVARPFTSAFQEIPTVARVTTTVSQGSAEFKIDFPEGSDPHQGLQAVDQAISQVRSSVPQATRITSVIVAPNSEPVLSYAITSPSLSLTVLREIATTNVVPKFFGVSGMGRLLLAGGSTREYHVLLNTARMQAAGLTVANVTAALATANTVAGTGIITRFYERYAVLVDSAIRRIEDIRAISIPTKNGATIPLDRIASVTLATAPFTVEASINGTHAVVLNVYAVPGADTVRMADEFRERLASIHRILPRDVSVTPFWDQTTLITASQRALRDAILLGAVLAVIVIFGFLRDIRLTLIAAAVIPIAMAIALFALDQAHQTLNLMSVGGLAVAVGLIIDDAIVVIENLARHRSEGNVGDAEQSIESAMRQIRGPMIASTLSTVVVFLPLALLTGVSGFFFRALALTLSASLIVSLALAISLAPIVARYLHRPPEKQSEQIDPVSVLLTRYDDILRWALGHRVAVGVIATLTLITTFVLLRSTQSDFLPFMDEGQFEITYTMPTGTTLAASDAAATAMEHIIEHDPAVASVGRLSAIDPNGYSPTQSNQGLLRVRLIDQNRRSSYDEVSSRLRDQLQAEIPASRYDMHQILEDMINDIYGTSAPIAIAVHGTNQEALIALATKLADRIKKIPGIVDTSSGVVYDNPTLQLTPNVTDLTRRGLTVDDLTSRASALTQGTVATNIPSVPFTVPVRVQIADSTPFRTALAPFAAISTNRKNSDIMYENSQRTIFVTANVQGASLSSITPRLQDAISTIGLPPGYSADIGGQIRTQQQSFRQFLLVIGIAVVLVYTVILATFHSYRLPLVILAAIPLALIGVVLALRMTGTSLNIASFMGLLLLVGIVVKNGILLIDAANMRRREGESIEDALVTAGKTRLRPILMTTLATIGGLIPLALGIGQGAEMERPLAIAVIGGLSTATIFTLVLIPVLYDVVERRTESAKVGS
jgi:CzcA family heavy metal efflux pump